GAASDVFGVLAVGDRASASLAELDCGILRHRRFRNAVFRPGVRGGTDDGAGLRRRISRLYAENMANSAGGLLKGLDRVALLQHLRGITRCGICRLAKPGRVILHSPVIRTEGLRFSMSKMYRNAILACTVAIALSFAGAGAAFSQAAGTQVASTKTAKKKTASHSGEQRISHGKVYLL